MTISGLNILFDYSSYLSILSYQVVNISSADDFASDSCFRLLLYHRYCSRPSSYQIVNISNIDKHIDRHSHSRSMSSSLSTSSQTSVSTDTPWGHNTHLRYSYNSRHQFDMADSYKTMSQELLRLKNWVLPTIPNSQEEFAELPTIDISIISLAPFNTLV